MSPAVTILEINDEMYLSRKENQMKEQRMKGEEQKSMPVESKKISGKNTLLQLNEKRQETEERERLTTGRKKGGKERNEN